MAQTTIHHGPADSIPPTASPGLQFLKSLLRTLDSLHPEEVQTLPQFLTPDATFTINGGAAVPTEQVLPMLTGRGQKLARFGHEVHVAWDIAVESGNANSRTVMYESTSVTVFKEDGEGEEIKVREFTVVELVQEDGEWKARELRTVMDASPVYKHAQKLQPKAE